MAPPISDSLRRYLRNAALAAGAAAVLAIVAVSIYDSRGGVPLEASPGVTEIRVAFPHATALHAVYTDGDTPQPIADVEWLDPQRPVSISPGATDEVRVWFRANSPGQVRFFDTSIDIDLECAVWVNYSPAPYEEGFVPLGTHHRDRFMSDTRRNAGSTLTVEHTFTLEELRSECAGVWLREGFPNPIDVSFAYDATLTAAEDGGLKTIALRADYQTGEVMVEDAIP